MIRTTTFVISAAMMTGPAVAQEAKVSAPQYYIDALYALQVAENVHEFCPTYSLNEATYNEQKRWIKRRLKDDGFDPENPQAKMKDVDRRLAAKEGALRKKFGFESDSEAGYCTAAKFEIAEQSLIGKMLKAVQ
jgi:hypothetical protein